MSDVSELSPEQRAQLRPCDNVTYVHFCQGGPHDGQQHPAEHCYETLEIGGVTYERAGKPERIEQPPTLRILNCTDDFGEPACFRVDMKLRKDQP